MLVSTVIMGGLAVVFILMGYYKGQHIEGLKITLNMMVGVLPLLVFAFVMAGMIQVLLPKELVLKWIGKESGIKVILGWRFTLIRIASTFFFPPIAGLIAQKFL